MIPKEIKTVLKEKYCFPEQPLMAQVATLSPEGPDIRTMRLFDFASERPIFLTHRGNRKFQQLSENPSLAACLLNKEWNTQIILRGEAELKNRETDPDLCQQLWKKMRYDVRKIYADDLVEGPYVDRSDFSVPENAPSQFGMIFVTPSQWELLELNMEDYPQSKRLLFTLSEGQWKKERINVA